MKKIKYLPIINRSESCRVKVSDICFISRDNRKLFFGTEDGTKMTYAKISSFEEFLGPEFVRCMSGCIINLAKVKDMKDLTVYFDNGETMELSRDSFLRAKQKYNAYLRKLLPSDDKESGKEDDDKND